MATLIYQAPNDEKHKSGPVGEDETQRRAILEAAGWRVVERHEDTQSVVEEELQWTGPVQAPDDPRAKMAQSSPTFDVDATEMDTLDFLSDEQQHALVSANYATLDSLRNASDADLRGVSSIGPAALRHIREALAK